MFLLVIESLGQADSKADNESDEHTENQEENQADPPPTSSLCYVFVVPHVVERLALGTHDIP